MRSPPEMPLTRLATRGDLSQLRWARWQSARSFDAHPLYAYDPQAPLPKVEGRPEPTVLS
jgi:hypothetical protein